MTFFAPRFKAYAIRIGCGNEEAEEVAQEAMISVWRKADSFDRTKATASTWMFTMVRNKRIDLIRREKRPTVDFEEVANEPAETLDAGDTYDAVRAGQAIREAMATLPEEQRLVI